MVSARFAQAKQKHSILLYFFALRQELSWLEHAPDKGEVEGSSPFWRIDRGRPNSGRSLSF